MKNISIWSEKIEKNTCPELKQNIETDVLIIGGGITGISTAYHLRNSNLKVCLAEKNTIGSGVTSRTTGKLTFLQANIYSRIKNYHGIEKAKLYLDSQIDSIELVKNIISDNKISCDLEKVDSYVFDLNKNKKIEKELDVLKKLNVNVKISNKLPNKIKVNNAFYCENTYVFHPIKYLNALKNICLNYNIDIYENTKIIKINKINNIYYCKTNKNTIKTKKIILAMHYPYFLLPFLTPLKTSIEKSYIEAFRVKQDYHFSSISISKPTISTRYHNDNNDIYQLYLTNSHYTYIKENDKKNFNKLLKRKNENPEYLWSNKDIITNDYLPFIGAIDKNNTFLIGCGYNTWGMTNGSLAGQILANIAEEKPNKYIELFNPLRKINIGKIIHFPLIIGGNALAFIKSRIKKQKKWYSPNVKFTKKNGKQVAIYIDDNKKEHIVYNICPHLKCRLIFNEIEKTWDCPCHGSRFDVDGKSIEGPSNYDISYKE